jgi:hypothetical protein
VKWLFAVVYPIKRIARERMGKNFVEPPFEGLSWTLDTPSFREAKLVAPRRRASPAAASQAWMSR